MGRGRGVSRGIGGRGFRSFGAWLGDAVQGEDEALRNGFWVWWRLVALACWYICVGVVETGGHLSDEPVRHICEVILAGTP